MTLAISIQQKLLIFTCVQFILGHCGYKTVSKICYSYIKKSVTKSRKETLQIPDQIKIFQQAFKLTTFTTYNKRVTDSEANVFPFLFCRLINCCPKTLRTCLKTSSVSCLTTVRFSCTAPPSHSRLNSSW